MGWAVWAGWRLVDYQKNWNGNPWIVSHHFKDICRELGGDFYRFCLPLGR